MLDERAKSLLKTLVERYIADGQPVGSRTLSKASGLELSPATIRNVMADLEDTGLIVSPHTSAGRVPTSKNSSVIASAASPPSAMHGSSRAFCVSEPNSISGFIAWKLVA